jgi:hypothetical protein
MDFEVVEEQLQQRPNEDLGSKLWDEYDVKTLKAEIIINNIMNAFTDLKGLEKVE